MLLIFFCIHLVKLKKKLTWRREGAYLFQGRNFCLFTKSYYYIQQNLVFVCQRFICNKYIQHLRIPKTRKIHLSNFLAFSITCSVGFFGSDQKLAKAEENRPTQHLARLSKFLDELVQKCLDTQGQGASFPLKYLIHSS